MAASAGMPEPCGSESCCMAQPPRRVCWPIGAGRTFGPTGFPALDASPAQVDRGSRRQPELPCCMQPWLLPLAGLATVLASCRLRLNRSNSRAARAARPLVCKPLLPRAHQHKTGCGSSEGSALGHLLQGTGHSLRPNHGSCTPGGAGCGAAGGDARLEGLSAGLHREGGLGAVRSRWQLGFSRGAAVLEKLP